VALTLAAAGMDLAFVHPTYALFVALPLLGFAVVRALAGADVRRSAGGLVAFGGPVLLVFAWLAPIVSETLSHNPGSGMRARGLRLLVLPVALASGIVFQLEFPGDFGMRVQHTGPAFAAWVALWGGLAGVLAIVVLTRRGGGRFERPDRLAGLAALLFVLPVAVHGFAHWDRGSQRDRTGLTTGLVQFLRTRVPERAVVFADLETSYRISAYAPVYVAVAPPTPCANTRANRPAKRRAAWLAFVHTGNLAIPRSFHAGWLVLRGREHVGPGARLVYRDGRFRVYRL